MSARSRISRLLKRTNTRRDVQRGRRNSRPSGTEEKTKGKQFLYACMPRADFQPLKTFRCFQGRTRFLEPSLLPADSRRNAFRLLALRIHTGKRKHLQAPRPSGRARKSSRCKVETSASRNRRTEKEITTEDCSSRVCLAGVRDTGRYYRRKVEIEIRIALLPTRRCRVAQLYLDS